MGKSVAGRRHGTPDAPEQTGMMPQPVADIVEADSVGKLRVEQGHDVAPRGEGPRLGFDPILPRQLSD